MNVTLGRTLPHILAGALGLAFAWSVSRTDLVASGVQFIAPLIVILLTHLLWLALPNGLSRGYTERALARSSTTALVLVLALLLGSLSAPMPAQAQAGVIGDGLVVIACVLILAVLILIVVLILRLIFRVAAKLLKRGDDDTKLHDLGGIIAIVSLLSLTSLEGVPGLFSFATQGSSTASRVIEAKPAQVWATLETATSPAFPLPGVLATFPHPVAVEVDEGTDLGANRVVRMEGREGAGHLSLRVTERSAQRATFTVLSDTSPFANWVAFQRLSYSVQAHPEGTRLDVTLNFERKLSPKWFFGPAITGAAYLAMDVLARDVKARSLSPDPTSP